MRGREGDAGGGSGPLRAGPRFYRAHGLGNDYLVFESSGSDGPGWRVAPDSVQEVCHRHEGVGSDGVVVLVDRSPRDGVFPLRMFNPDGSEFERSGNGLRILASFLVREGLVGRAPFRVRSGGSVIRMTVHGSGPGGRFDISVEMGVARVGLSAIGVDVASLDGEGRATHPALGAVEFVPVSMGNPHAVVFPPDPTEGLLHEVGPFLATHPAFPAGTNVQLVQRVAPGRIRIWIWERGVGRTSASGTSSCASAVAAVSTGRVEAGRIEVEMEGGVLQVSVTPELEVVLRGPVVEVAEGRLTDGFLEALQLLPDP